MVNVKLKSAGTFLIVALAIDLSGCRPKEQEQVIANKIVASEQALITGQIFIVTKGRENVVLGDEKVALLDAKETRTYFNSKALEWSNTLAIAQAKVDQAATSYDALYKDELAKFATAKKYHNNIMQTVPTDSQEWRDAFEWSQKVRGSIRDLHKLKKSSAEKKQFDDAVEVQSRLWNEINWPSADHFWPRIGVTTTDSEGRFKFVVTKSYADSSMMLFAKAERQIGDEKENYWWMVNVNLNGRKTDEFILSNDNKDSIGVSYYFDEKSMQDYMDHYITKMEDDKAHRDNQDWLDNLEDGDGK